MLETSLVYNIETNDRIHYEQMSLVTPDFEVELCRYVVWVFNIVNTLFRLSNYIVNDNVTSDITDRLKIVSLFLIWLERLKHDVIYVPYRLALLIIKRVWNFDQYCRIRTLLQNSITFQEIFRINTVTVDIATKRADSRYKNKQLMGFRLIKIDE